MLEKCWRCGRNAVRFDLSGRPVCRHGCIFTSGFTETEESAKETEDSRNAREKRIEHNETIAMLSEIGGIWN